MYYFPSKFEPSQTSNHLTNNYSFIQPMIPYQQTPCRVQRSAVLKWVLDLHTLWTWMSVRSGLAICLRPCPHHRTTTINHPHGTTQICKLSPTAIQRGIFYTNLIYISIHCSQCLVTSYSFFFNFKLSLTTSNTH